jgi:hypothetical protein
VDPVILYRPVGPKELVLIEAAGWKEFPPRLPEQPIFVRRRPNFMLICDG